VVRGNTAGTITAFGLSGSWDLTSLIVNDLQKGTFKFVAFWERRIRRIVPAMRCGNTSACNGLVSAPAQRVRCSGKVRHGLGSHCGKYLFLAKYHNFGDSIREKKGGVGEDSLLERVTAAADERQLSGEYATVGFRSEEDCWPDYAY
jgi:hypothetical protein